MNMDVIAIPGTNAYKMRMGVSQPVLLMKRDGGRKKRSATTPTTIEKRENQLFRCMGEAARQRWQGCTLTTCKVAVQACATLVQLLPTTAEQAKEPIS